MLRHILQAVVVTALSRRRDARCSGTSECEGVPRHSYTEYPPCPHHPAMPSHSLLITDAVEEASPMLRHMRLDGLHRATVPFSERYVLAWLGSPGSNIGLQTVVQVIKLWFVTADKPQVPRRLLCEEKCRPAGLSLSLC